MSRAKSRQTAADPQPAQDPEQKSNIWATWAEAFDYKTTLLRNPSEAFTPPPTDGDDEQQIPALLKAAKCIGLAAGQVNPEKAVGELWESRFGNLFRDIIKDATLQFAETISRAIAVRLRVEEHPDLILTSDFAELRLLDSGQRLPDKGMSPIYLAVGLVGSLPAGHRLGELMPADQLYHHASREPALVLGLTMPSGQPRPWYMTDLAISLTRYHRSRQVADAEERAAAECRERQREAVAWAESPLGQHLARERALQQMRDRGQLPDELAKREPAVRGAGVDLR